MSVPERQNCSGIDCRTVSIMTRTVPRNSAADVPKNYPPSFGSTAPTQRKCTCSICARGNNTLICPFQPILGVHKPSSDVGNIREQPTKDCNCCCTKPLSLYTAQGNEHSRNQKPISSYRVDSEDAVWNVKITKDFGIATASPDVGTITQTTETRMITAEQLENLLPSSNRYVLHEEGMQPTAEMGELGYHCSNVDCLNVDCSQLLANQRQARQVSESSEDLFLCDTEICQKENVCDQNVGKSYRPSRLSVTVARVTHENSARSETSESLSAKKQPVSGVEAQCAEKIKQRRSRSYASDHPKPGPEETRFKNPCCTRPCCKACGTDETRPQTPKDPTVRRTAYEDISEVDQKSYRELESKNQKNKRCTCIECVKEQPKINEQSTTKKNTAYENTSEVSLKSYHEPEVKNQKTKCCTCPESVKNQPVTNNQYTSEQNIAFADSSAVSQKSYHEPEVKNQKTKCCTCPESVKNQPVTNEQSKTKQNKRKMSESVKNSPVTNEQSKPKQKNTENKPNSKENQSKEQSKKGNDGDKGQKKKEKCVIL